MNDFALSPNFTLSEFACPCCGAVMLDHNLVEALQRLRVIKGAITITSGYRCPAYQKALHFARAELGRPLPVPRIEAHVLGQAADVSMRSTLRPSDELFLIEFGFTGLGFAPTWTHLDIAHPEVATWGYD